MDDKEERKRRKKEDARPIDDSMGLEERLERMGIDPAQYQKYGNLHVPSFAKTGC